MRELLKKMNDSLICSFLVSNLSDLLTIAHFLWATWANCSFLVSNQSDLLTLLIFGERPERFTDIAHQKRGNERFAHLFNKKLYIKHTKKQDFRFFYQNFFERIAHSLISSERHEPIAHCCSIVFSNLSDSLTIAHFLWATWAICWRLLIFLERSERVTHSPSFDLSKMSEWVTSSNLTNVVL